MSNADIIRWQRKYPNMQKHLLKEAIWSLRNNEVAIGTIIVLLQDVIAGIEEMQNEQDDCN